MIQRRLSDPFLLGGGGWFDAVGEVIRDPKLSPAPAFVCLEMS